MKTFFDNLLPYVLGAFLVSLIGYLIARSRDQKSKAQQMRLNFASLGDLIGKHADEITKRVGLPIRIDSRPDGGTFRQWVVSDFHVALTFDKNGLCTGVQNLG